MKKTKPATTPTPPETSSEIDWDLLDELETDPAQLDQDLVISKLLRNRAKEKAKT